MAAATLGGAVAASGPTVTVEPTGPLPAGTSTVTVSGSGFDPSGNGVYVVFGPITAAPGYYLDPSVYAAFKWVHPAGQVSGAEAPLAADGSFSTTLDIPSGFTNPAGPVDCATNPCAVITFGAHGSQDRSQDTCTAVTFAGGQASASERPAASAPSVTASATPSAVVPSEAPSSAGPEPSAQADPCAVITAAP